MSEDDVAKSYRGASTFKLSDEPIDHARPLRVIIIGAGFSGIALLFKFLQSLQNVEIVIYEKNEDVGGTWLESRYPGIACDVPALCYQFSFALHTGWSSYYPPGQETLQYLRDVSARIGLPKYTQFKHKVVNAAWSETKGKWDVTVERTDDGSRFQDSAHLVISAIGILNRWSLPDIPGINDFRGTVAHTANWTLGPMDSSWANRRVAVIGSGSTATQVVPAIQPHVKHLDNFVRGQAWIANVALPLLKQYPDGSSGNHVFSEAELRAFRENPEEFYELMRLSEDFLNGAHSMTIVGSPMQQRVRERLAQRMRDELKARPEIADALIPDYPVVCRRLTPGTGYLKALQATNFIKSGIARITPEGIETHDGQRRQYDVIVCATGYDASFIPRFPVVGRNGVTLRECWQEYPRTYMGLCQDQHPNWFQMVGPNTAMALGSLIPVVEAQADYVVKVIQKMQRQRIKAMTVRKEAVDDFQRYLDSYFPRTVFARKCRSWYKRGDVDGKVVALWPGSSLNELRALEQPRWEDYEYTFVDDNAEQNRLYWLGNGSTQIEDEGKRGTRAWYLPRKPQLLAKL
ncbi:flavin-binding monooxygenase [Phanerochaete sordida]|uniref:Flavin-binding monooxygenase n=1 Tax=Phanerochaete sordida TaxID=48140 RepID=A0A9P3LGI4_9APHY|nr:flavin-binding monooxygenase [Phanerochaete sordida]